MPTRTPPLRVVPVPSGGHEAVAVAVCSVPGTRADSLPSERATRFVCRLCAELKYVTVQWRSPARLMSHYGRERERLDAQAHLGPRSSRYWSIAAREARAVQDFIQQLARHTRPRIIRSQGQLGPPRSRCRCQDMALR